MSMNLIEPGDQLLVVHRRLFERDENRFFVGQVEASDGGVIRITGFTFVRDVIQGRVRRKAEARTKLLSLTSGTLIVYVLPKSVDVAKVEICCDEAEMWITDGNEFTMNLSEWTHRGH